MVLCQYILLQSKPADGAPETSCYIYCFNLNTLDDEKLEKINKYVTVI